MKKITLFLISLFLLLAPTAVLAETEVSVETEKEKTKDPEKVIVLPADEVVNKDYFAAGEVVEISGTVNGDVYAAGGQILIDGTVNGDVLAAGGDINISGKVAQNIRTAGGQITISGQVGRNLTIGAGNVEVTNAAQINGNLVAGAGNITLAAPIAGDLKVGAGQLTISNQVAGDIEAAVGSLRLTSKAKVNGDLTYWSDKEASIADTSAITGEITKKLPPEEVTKGLEDFKAKTSKAPQALGKLNFIFKLFSLISGLIIGLLLIYFLPRYSEEVTKTLVNRPWASLLTGFLTLILTPLIVILLMITVVGIPLSLIILASYFIAICLAKVLFALYLGTLLTTRLLGRKQTPSWTLVIGLFALTLLGLIPSIGNLVFFIALLFGLGAAVITKRKICLSTQKKGII